MRKTAILALLCTAVTVNAQQSVRLDLERAFQLATDSSVTADRYRSVFQEAHYAWLSWMAGRKPQIDLTSTPLQYEQYMTQRYVSDTDNDEYREQKRFLSSANLQVQQIMERWGGSFYASTGLAYLGNYGDYIQHQFATTPVKVGYRQELLGYNSYRWSRQTEPMRLNVAQQQMNYSVEQTGAEAVRRFFTLAVAQEQLNMAQEQLQSCDSILAIGKRRFNIASISKAELEILTLQRSLAITTLKSAQLSHQKAAKSLAVWLGMDELTNLELIVPSILPHLSVTVGDAINQATQHNPNYLSMELKELEARRDAEQLKRKKGLNASIDASIGLNQVAESFEHAYRTPLMQNQVTVNLTVPISDHGKRRNAWLAAQNKVETAVRQRQEQHRDTELDIVQTVAEVNQRQSIVDDTRHSLQIAEDAYTAMLQRFIRGQATVNDLSLAQQYWQDARRSQITALQDFWNSYYHLRQLTLYDFLKQQPIRH
jgi:outer membrane protein TolC